MIYRWITLLHNRSYLKSTVKLSKKLDIKRKVCTIYCVIEASIFSDLNITKIYFKTIYEQRSKTAYHTFCSSPISLHFILFHDPSIPQVMCALRTMTRTMRGTIRAVCYTESCCQEGQIRCVIGPSVILLLL